MASINCIQPSSFEILNQCIEKIREQAKPRSNDKRFLKYVNFINVFLKHFGEERVYLVGSTGEGTKLTLPADDGDADYLLVSGEIAVPVDCLEFKPDCQSYTWVRGDRIQECEEFDLLDGVYLDANLLRDVTPQLFNIARGIYLHLSANIDRMKAANEDVTTLGTQSKVGLAHTTYRNIEIHGDLEKYRQARLEENGRTKFQSNRTIESSSSVLHPDDNRIIKRVYEMVQIAKRQGDQDTYHGNFAFFAMLLEEAIKETQTVTDVHSKSDHVEPEVTQKPSNFDGDMQANTDIKLVYKRTVNKDFVPSLRVNGKLKCMDSWRERVTDAGLDKETVDDVYNTDTFLISRESLINPDKSKDFCIAFGLHEKKIVKRFSDTQKMAYLMLKTLRKGLFDLKMGGNKFRTYHVKTIAFWRFEEELRSFQKEDCSATELFQSLINSLLLLKKSVDSKTLKHYFTCDNLFANFKDSDFQVIGDTLDKVLDSPLASVMNALDLNQVVSREIILTKGEVYLLLDLHADGGKEENIRRVREAMCDIINGVNKAKKRQRESKSDLKDAILEVTRLVFEDEIAQQTERTENDSRNQVQFGDLFKSVQKAVKKDQKKSQENIDMIVNFASLLSNIVPSINKGLDKIGGTETIRTVLEGAAGMDDETDAVNIDELMVLLEQFLTCSEEEKYKIGNELKVKFACIFF